MQLTKGKLNDSCLSLSIAKTSRLCPSLAIGQLGWRPPAEGTITGRTNAVEEDNQQIDLAVASDDSSLRILSINLTA